MRGCFLDSENRSMKLALSGSSLRFTEGGREGGPDLQIQNYMDIGKDSIRKQNLSRNEVPRPCLRGGGRGGVPIEGARNFAAGMKSGAK